MKLHHSLGEMVIRKLETLCSLSDIPKQSVLAGQAVASAIFEILRIDALKPAYNDVDIFIDKDFYTTLTDEQANEIKINCSSFPERNGVKIVSTIRLGIRNDILCSFNKRIGGKPVELLITGFDLSCVQVGVDMRTRELVWTPDFEQFIETLEVKIMTPLTPYHTLVRYFIKKHELGALGDDRIAIELTAAELSHGTTLLFSNFDLNEAFTRFNDDFKRNKYDKVRDKIEPFFTLDEHLVMDDANNPTSKIYALKPLATAIPSTAHMLKYQMARLEDIPKIAYQVEPMPDPEYCF